MRHKLSQIQTQRQVLAPLMQQSIALLLLPLTDLNLTIEQELQNNPLLETVEDDENLTRQLRDQGIRQNFKYLDTIPHIPSDHLTSDDDQPEDRSLVKELTLEENLWQQLQFETTDAQQLKIGELIIGNLDEDGYLKATCEEIAVTAGALDMTQVENVLSLIQNFEPIGIAARTLCECILIQLRAKNCNGTMAARIVTEHLEDLGKKRYADIARQVGIGAEEVKKISQIISGLDPRPARNYRPISQTIYIKPDVFIAKDERGQYQIVMNDEGMPQIRISPLYKNMLNRKDLTEEEKDFIRAKLENAISFIKSIEQRGQTIREITKYVLAKQKEFFEGNHLAIAPLTLKDVAEAIHRNESTISRAMSNKYIDTPQGLFPMKYFFSQAITTDSTLPTSSQSVKQEIQEIVESENKSSPLSDHDIKEHFERKGVRLARRTITKYRKTLRIPPSYLRKN